MRGRVDEDEVFWDAEFLGVFDFGFRVFENEEVDKARDLGVEEGVWLVVEEELEEGVWLAEEEAVCC